MENTVVIQIMDFKTKTLEELKAKYEELFTGKKATSNNKVFLWRKIAYRIQELNYQGLSDDTQRRIKDLIARYDPVNNKSLRPQESAQEMPSKHSSRDKRLPIPGSVITKVYKDRSLEIKVLDKGFEFEGKTFRTLSAVACHVTGVHWNGYLFFNI
jgi:hypothetical protein